jgi:hypothetical protein
MEITDSLNIDVTDDVSDSINRDSNNSNGSFTCPICMNEMTDEEQCITECNHHFCRGCIHGWFDRCNFTCPSCRGEINYYMNNLEKNNIIKVNISNRNVNNVNNANNQEIEILRNRIRFYHYLLFINFLYTIYNLYDGIKMGYRINYYNSLYNNCTNKLEEIEQQYDTTSNVMLYFQQKYIECEFPTYFLNQCIAFYFNTMIH